MSTLIFTGGGMTWHVSLVFRDKNPLPFSEEHDGHVECMLGIGPDIIVFLDYYTKVGMAVGGAVGHGLDMIGSLYMGTCKC